MALPLHSMESKVESCYSFSHNILTTTKFSVAHYPDYWITLPISLFFSIPKEWATIQLSTTQMKEMVWAFSREGLQQIINLKQEHIKKFMKINGITEVFIISRCLSSSKIPRSLHRMLRFVSRLHTLIQSLTWKQNVENIIPRKNIQ